MVVQRLPAHDADDAAAADDDIAHEQHNPTSHTQRPRLAEHLQQVEDDERRELPGVQCQPHVHHDLRDARERRPAPQERAQAERTRRRGQRRRARAASHTLHSSRSSNIIATRRRAADAAANAAANSHRCAITDQHDTGHSVRGAAVDCGHGGQVEHALPMRDMPALLHLRQSAGHARGGQEARQKASRPRLRRRSTADQQDTGDHRRKSASAKIRKLSTRTTPRSAK